MREPAARDWGTRLALRLKPPVAALRGPPEFVRMSLTTDSKNNASASYRLWCRHQRHMRAPITATTTKQQNSASSEGGARSPEALAAASWSKTACAWGIALCVLLLCNRLN